MSESEFGGEIDPELVEPAPEPAPPYAGESDEPDWGDAGDEPEAPGLDPSELEPYPESGSRPRDEEEYLPTDELPDEPADPGEPELEPEPPQVEPPYAGESDEPDHSGEPQEPDPEPEPEPEFPDDEPVDEGDVDPSLIGEPFWWESDPEPQGEEVAIRGETVVSFDDVTETVTITGPEGESETRPYEPPERTRRASSIFAARLEADLTRELGEHDRRLAEAREKVAEVASELEAAQEAVDKAAREAAEAREKVQDAIDAAFDATTSADAAAGQAAEAKQKADQAEATALAAQAGADALAGRVSTLDGKITVSTRNPAASDASGKPEGAIWEVRDGGTIRHRYMLVGSAWTPVVAGQDLIGENAVGAAQIIDASIGTAKIADAAITNAKIGSMSVAKLIADVAKMDKAAVEQLIGDAAYFKVLQANKIIIADDATNKVGATLIENGAITTAKLYATADMWAKLLTVAGDATIGGNLIVDDTIDVSKLRVDAAYAREMAAMMARFQSAFIGKLTAQMIQADSFDGYEVRGARIVSPGKAGDITISDNTITSSRRSSSGELEETMVIGGRDGDSIALTPRDDEPPTVVISGNGGNASFAGDVAVGDLLVDNQSLAEWMRQMPRGVLGWTWASGAALPDMTNTPYGLVRFIWPLEKGRRYKLCGEVIFQGTPGDVVEFNFHWRAHETSPAVVGSPYVGTRRFQIPTGGVGSAHIEYIFSETYDYENYSALVSMRNWSTSTRPVCLWSDGGSPQSQSHFWLEDIGPFVNASSIEWDGGGGKTFKAVTPPKPPPPQKRTYTKTYQASSAFSWRGSTEVSDVLHHGTHQGIRRKSQIIFPYQVQQDLTGATIKKVELRLKNLHTYAGSGMTVSIATATNNSKSSSPSGVAQSREIRVPWGKGQTKFVTINDWKANTRSVYLGHYADSSGQFYGKFSRALSDCVLRVTYEK